ncbi:IclR family transcriptional regulator [Roseovarius sp. S1116L3]|uniref:IclR family transcriptional regulator n=1 Tax=Roseovarius roseus TaxID=3342636 RepID=UPI00372C491D
MATTFEFMRQWIATFRHYTRPNATRKGRRDKHHEIGSFPDGTFASFSRIAYTISVKLTNSERYGQLAKDTDSETEKTGRGVAAVDRALSIIAALEKGRMPLNLSEIARSTELYKSTILRLLESLQGAGYVVRVEENKYALGPTIMQLGLAYERSNPLRHQILPVMEKLVDMGTESPSFHMRQTADERLCLFRLNSNHSTLDRVHTGDRLPVRRGAAGKVLVAFGEPHEAGAEMDQIRGECFAVSLGERDKLCAGIAAPVFSGSRRLVGALSFSGPKERFTEADIARMKGQMMEAVREISNGLGSSYPV